LQISVEPSFDVDLLAGWDLAGQGDWLVESATTLQRRLGTIRGVTVRRLGVPATEVWDPNTMGMTFVIAGRPLCNGRLELQWYVREQAISETVHRYGNLI
jgi:RHH-type proline utilization regulon transcriptional repressor/proline dehydrogenase/delta 1-pyrroline-5-carboxylate dehydrogenase